MISHRNYYAMASVIDHLPGYVRDDDLMLLYLPLAHNFGRLMHLTGPYVGYTIAFLPDPLQTADALHVGPPDRAAERPARVREDPHGGRRRDRRDDGRQAPPRRLVARGRSRGRAGERRPACRSAACCGRSTGSPTGSSSRRSASGSAGACGRRSRAERRSSQEIAEFFDAIGIRILEGYGLTECTTAATTNTPERWRFGTVGPALPGFELRIADDGELLIRSETVFGGYYKDPEATAEVLGADGWLRSGDIAEIDADGFVKITDRKKDIIVTAGGKNIAPQNIENDLKASKYISQALVVGDRRPYPAALVTLDAVEIGKWAEAQGIAGDDGDAGRRRARAGARAGRSSTTSTGIGRGSSRSSGSRSCRATSRSSTTR